MSATSLSRRALLFGRGPKPQPQPSIRPPWARPASAFADACTRCGDCVAACPERVLSMDATGRPVFDPASGECSFCGACAESCASGALSKQPSAPPWTWRAVVSERCLGRQGVVCFSCQDACPQQAIVRAPGRLGGLRVDAERCNGCGACVGVCPAAAVRFECTAEASP